MALIDHRDAAEARPTLSSRSPAPPRPIAEFLHDYGAEFL
jgi:hypothetical protein